MDELEEIRARKVQTYWNEMKPPTVTLERKIPNSPIEITDENFASMIQDYDFLVVDCWAPWCGPCRMLSPVIDELARDYEGEVVFGKLNTDKNRGVATEFGIMSIPTILLIKKGRLVDKIVGAVPKEVIESKLGKYI
ncbi:MAG: thioredoxin [Thermoplasmata archaeon]